MPRYVCVLIFWIIAGAVLWPHTLVPQAYGLAESTGPDGSNAQAVHELGETGQGINVGLISARNSRTTHEAFKDPNNISHAFSYDFTDENLYEPDSHDTWMAGIIASRGGTSYPNDIGVAPGTDIHSGKVTRGETSPSDPNRVISFSWMADALDTLVNDHNCRVIVTGIAIEPASISPDGQSDWTLLYDYYAYEHDAVFANASGNNGTIVIIFGDAYNGITTGGLRLNDPNNEYVYRRVGYDSGSGLTVDGRRKPDVVGPSQGQTMPGAASDTSWYTWLHANGATSLSVPHTAGAAALLLGLANETTEPNDAHNEVIKAVIVNSTFPNIDDKAGDQTNPADANNTWNPDRGYGRIDALRAYELLDANQITTDANITQQKGWAFGSLDDQEEHTYSIRGQKHQRLVATLTWDRRIEWTDSWPWGKINAGELNAYLADLDLLLYQPNDANAIFSETLFGLDPNDNLEKCDILLAANGEYSLRIVNDSGNGESADYGLAFELLPPTPGDFEPNYIVDNHDFANFADSWRRKGPGLDADLFPDGSVNLRDLAILVENWLKTDPAYYQQP